MRRTVDGLARQERTWRVLEDAEVSSRYILVPESGGWFLLSTSSFRAARCYGAERWANAVARAATAGDDFRTLEEWGRRVGVSRGALRERCRLVGVTPKDSLAFARLLRAVIVAPTLGWDIANVLNVSDTRTLKKLVERGGLSLTHACASPTVEAFLAGQHLIREPRLLDELQEQLREVMRVESVVKRSGTDGPSPPTCDSGVGVRSDHFRR